MTPAWIPEQAIQIVHAGNSTMGMSQGHQSSWVRHPRDFRRTYSNESMRPLHKNVDSQGAQSPMMNTQWRSRWRLALTKAASESEGSERACRMGSRVQISKIILDTHSLKRTAKVSCDHGAWSANSKRPLLSHMAKMSAKMPVPRDRPKTGPTLMSRVKASGLGRTRFCIPHQRNMTE